MHDEERLFLENSNIEASHTRSPKKAGSNLSAYPFVHRGSSELQVGAGAFPCSQTGEASPTIIHHPPTPNNEIYAGMGRPCKKCKCFFQNSHDYALHQQICKELGWRRSAYGNGNRRIRPVEDDPELAHALTRQGKITIGSVTYSLSTDKKWIIREPLP